MKHLRIIQTAACAALLVAALAPRTVKADEWDKRTIMKFSDTVQVPGATLPAGSYVFKLVESNANRYVVQVFNERENHIFSTIIAIPDYRLEPRGKTVVTFYEAPVGQPQPVRAWFYPGDNYGREFVYGKKEAALIASYKNQTVRTDETTAVAANTTPAPQNSEINTTETLAQQSAAVATEPQNEIAIPTEPPPPPAVAAEPEPLPQPQEPPMVKSDESTTEQPTDTAAPAPEALPATGSELPLIGLVGLVSLVGALSVRAARRFN